MLFWGSIPAARRLARARYVFSRSFADRDGVLVGDHVDTVKFVLHICPVADRANIVSQCELITRGLDPTEDDFLLFDGNVCHILSTPFLESSLPFKGKATSRNSIPFFFRLGNLSGPSFTHNFKTFQKNYGKRSDLLWKKEP